MFSKNARLPYILIAPSSILFLLFVFYPIIKTITWSLSEISLGGQITSFVGLSNFIHLSNDPVFWQVFRQTLLWVIGCVGITTFISIPVALALNEQFPGRKLARLIILIPWAFSLPMATVVWRWIFHTDLGMLNHGLRLIGILPDYQMIPWLAQPNLAFLSLIIVGVWASIPFTSIVLLSGLQSIPDHLYEASRIDGASRISSFWHVTLPLLKPTLLVVSLMNTIYVFNAFAVIWVLTQGRPVDYTHTMMTFLYKRAFIQANYGSACAMAVITFTILIILSIIFTRISTREQDVTL